jgi:hypothetical protein
MSSGTETVSGGFQIPPFERVTDLANWNRFAAVNDEFVPIHMDDAAGRKAGYPGAFGMGNLQASYLHSLLRQWIGPDGRIDALACRYKKPMLRGTQASAQGVVTNRLEVDDRVEFHLSITLAASGEVLAEGTATVSLVIGSEGPSSRVR